MRWVLITAVISLIFLPVPVSSDGSLAIANFVVTCSGCSRRTQSQVCISNYDPCMGGLGPEPACTAFTYT